MFFYVPLVFLLAGYELGVNGLVLGWSEGKLAGFLFFLFFFFFFWLLLDGLVVCVGDETSGGKSSSGVEIRRESKLAVRKGSMVACWGV